ncbi:hypothetical protein LLE95_06115, partial [Pediococcus acidilactici]|nr:hypothetical protein [Pediococcus acidilactici]
MATIKINHQLLELLLFFRLLIIPPLILKTKKVGVGHLNLPASTYFIKLLFGLLSELQGQLN